MKRNQNQKSLTETSPKRTGTLVWWWIINKNDRRVVTGLGKILECGIRESNIRTSIAKNWATWPTSWSNLSEYRMMLYFVFVFLFLFSFVHFMCCYRYRNIMTLFNRKRYMYIFCTSTWLYILNICIYTYIPNKTHLVYYWVEVIHFFKMRKIYNDRCMWTKSKASWSDRVIELYFTNFIELYWQCISLI